MMPLFLSPQSEPVIYNLQYAATMSRHVCMHNNHTEVGDKAIPRYQMQRDLPTLQIGVVYRA